MVTLKQFNRTGQPGFTSEHLLNILLSLPLVVTGTFASLQKKLMLSMFKRKPLSPILFICEKIQLHLSFLEIQNHYHFTLLVSSLFQKDQILSIYVCVCCFFFCNT